MLFQTARGILVFLGHVLSPSILQMTSLIGPMCSAQNLQHTVGCRLFQQVECAAHKIVFSHCLVDKKKPQLKQCSQRYGRIQLQKGEPMRERGIFYLLLMVDLRLEVHHKLKLISTMCTANFTNAIINLISPFSYIVAAWAQANLASFKCDESASS